MRPKKRVADPRELGRKLGIAIATRRKAKRLTQDELAGLVDVDAETISRFERGNSLPSLHRLLVVAEALDVGVGELLSDASPLPSDRTHQLMASMEVIDERDQQLLLDFIHLLRKRQ